MSIKINTGYGDRVASEDFNQKIHVLMGGNVIVRGFEVSKGDRLGLLLSPGSAVVTGAIISDDAINVISIPENLSQQDKINLVLTYAHRERLVTFEAQSSGNIAENALLLASLEMKTVTDPETGESVRDIDEDSIKCDGPVLTPAMIAAVIGNIDGLPTTDKTSIVSAIIEIFNNVKNIEISMDGSNDELTQSINQISAVIGNMSGLPTTDKTSIVSAIKEIYSGIGNGTVTVNGAGISAGTIDVGKLNSAAYATVEEAIAGTNSTKLVTPRTMRQAILSSGSSGSAVKNVFKSGNKDFIYIANERVNSFDIPAEKFDPSKDVVEIFHEGLRTSEEVEYTLIGRTVNLIDYYLEIGEKVVCAITNTSFSFKDLVDTPDVGDSDNLSTDSKQIVGAINEVSNKLDTHEHGDIVDNLNYTNSMLQLTSKGKPIGDKVLIAGGAGGTNVNMFRTSSIPKSYTATEKGNIIPLPDVTEGHIVKFIFKNLTLIEGVDYNVEVANKRAVLTFDLEVGETIHYLLEGVSYRYSDLSGTPTSLPANGGNADTVDGKHASDFALAHTHPYTSLNSIQIGGTDADTFRSRDTWIGRTDNNVSNSPPGYNTLVNFGADANSNFQLSHAYNGSSIFKVRGRKDTDGVYTPWASVFTSATPPTKADVGLSTVPNSGFTAGQVLEIGQYLDFHKSGSTADYDARIEVDANNALMFVDAGGRMHVTGEINNLKSSVSSGKTAIANAITGKGVSASGSDTHATLANKIGQITSISSKQLVWEKFLTNAGKCVTYKPLDYFNPAYFPPFADTNIIFSNADATVYYPQGYLLYDPNTSYGYVFQPEPKSLYTELSSVGGRTFLKIHTPGNLTFKKPTNLGSGGLRAVFCTFAQVESAPIW